MIKLAMAGAAGRMGKSILNLAIQDPEIKIVGGLEQRDSAALGTDIGELLGHKAIGAKIESDADKVLKQADVLIDFTHPSALPAHLEAVLKAKIGYVIGTTGLSEKELVSIREASKQVAIIQSPNMSIGVNLLLKLAELTGAALDDSYDIEIMEIHHRNKKDAPSGTALKLFEVLAESRKIDAKKKGVFGRQGEIGVRPKGEIGVFALRGGDVVGEHTISFFGEGERIELTHRASSRDAFAQGALRAAKFVAKSKPGLYHMQQVLGIA